MSRAEQLDYREREASWIEDWARFAGRGAVADQVRFEREWSALRRHAAERGMRLIGDIPIYVAPGSADHRAHPELFRGDAVAGTPPDAYTDKGQLWGNPLYDWPALRRRRYRWWIARLARTFALFDLARIDHFRAFAAYWAVPKGARTALGGRWRRGPGRAVFDAARAALGELPLIAEDLGVITPAVERLRDGLGLPGMVVLQFGFDVGATGERARRRQSRRAPDRIHGHARQRHAPRLVRIAALRAPLARRRRAPGRRARGLVGPDRADVLVARGRRDGAGAGRARTRLGGAHEPAGARLGIVALAAGLVAVPRAGAAAARGHRGGGPRLDSRVAWPPLRARREILDVNRRYHDVAAAGYDSKWGIDFGAVGRAQVLGKVEKLLGRRPGPFARALEIGAGTGYFTLNLMQERVIGSGVCTDVSPGMLEALRANAERLGLAVETVVADAAALPFEDAGFDLVLGHAVLHHLPELGARVRGVHARAAPGRRAAVRRRAVATRRPHRRAAEARRRWRRPRSGAVRCARVRRPAPAATATAATTTRSRRWSTCARSRPPSSGAWRRPPASPPCTCAARSCSRTCSAGSTARWRRPRSTTTSRRAGSTTPTAATSCCRSSTRALLEPNLPAAGFYNLLLTARKP